MTRMRGHWSRLGSAIGALVTLFVASSAHAQSAEKFRAPENANNSGADTHLFRPAVDSKGFFSVNGSDILGKNDVSFGLILDYGRNILRTRDDTVPLRDVNGALRKCTPDDCGWLAPGDHGTGVHALVRDSFQGTFAFNYGIANIASVGINLPVILMSGDPAFDIGRTGQTYNSAQLDQQGLSTAALHGKIRILRVEKGFGLAALVQVGVPLGDAPQNLGADPGAWYWPQLLAEKRFGYTGRFRIAANVGYRGHTGTNAAFGDVSHGTGSQLKEGSFEYGNLATFQGGIAWRAIDALDLIAETYGTFLTGGASDSAQKLSQELLGGIKLFVEEKSYFTIGAGSRAFSTGFEAADLRLVLGFVFEPSIGDRDGDGLKDDEDQCPDDPEDFDNFEDGDGCPDPDNDKDGILDVDDACPNVPEDMDGDDDDDGCPEHKDGDRDGDGILDSKDKCPDDPEDKDGFEDRDGCPEPDNDHDKILDADDKCPNNPEVYNGFEDADGCPDKGRVVIEGSDILIMDKVQFDKGSAKILPESFPIIDAVADTLKAHSEFLVVEVAGHADERSNDDYNLKLTQARAKSVMEAMAQRGVAANRLVSQGYGEYCPLDPSHNDAAWDKNRRVEFKVVKTEDGLTGVDRGCKEAVAKGVKSPEVK